MAVSKGGVGMGNRPSWQGYFLNLACGVAQRSTCPRAHVGAVIVHENRILTTGYNGSLPGQPHCTEVGCDIRVINGVEHCGRAVHAEVNAVAQAAKFGVSIDGSTMYVWDELARGENCADCMRVGLSAGIRQVIFGGPAWRTPHRVT